jgi:hypothetical protein
MKLLTVQLSPFSCYFDPLKPKSSPLHYSKHIWNLKKLHRLSPNVAVQWLALLLHIWKVPHLIPSPDTVCYEAVKSFLVSKSKCWNSTLKQTMTVSFHPFTFII